MIPQITNPAVPTDDTSRLFDYQTASGRIKKLIKNWEQEKLATERRRRVRKLDINVDSLQRQGKLKSDETIIPIRVVDSSIRKEQPPFIAYLKQSRRLAIFRCTNKPGVDTEQLESDYTHGMTYTGWEKPYFKCLDGAQAHGWDWVEVEYDPSKPLHVGITHHGHDNIIIPLDCRDIQGAEMIPIRYEISPMLLQKWVTQYGFDPIEVKNYLEKQQQNKDEEKNIVIFKVLSKCEGIVYISWFAEDSCENWLRAPMKLFRGRRVLQETPVIDPGSGLPIMDPRTGMLMTQMTWVDQDESLYPLHPFFYAETEESYITDIRGRIYLDEPKQEAQTALWSAFVNGSVRASNVYGSPKNSTETSGIKQLDCRLEHGSLYNQPIEFWNTPYPDPAILRATNSLDTQTQAENGQVAFAVSNREDSRKTATEISTAQQQAALLSTVQVAHWANFLRSVNSDAWLIVQSLAMQDEIRLCLIPLPDSQDPMTGQPKYQNDKDTISLEYDVRPAGDIDVIQRAEKLARREALWPKVANTPLAIPFLMDMIKESLPEDAARYEEYMTRSLEQMAMQAQMQAQNTIPLTQQQQPQQQMQQMQ